MDSDVKISPMGYWVISLYKSNKITNTISLKTFDGLNEDVLKPVHVQMLSNRVYEKCLVYTQRYNEWELTVEQTKIAKSRARKQKIKNKNDTTSSVIEDNKLKKKMADNAVNELRQVLDIWFYSLGSRSSNRYCDSQRRPIYRCTVPDIKCLALSSNNISSIIKNQKDAETLFFEILVYSSGEILDEKFNLNKIDANLSCFIKKISDYVIPSVAEAQIPKFDSKVHTLYIYKGLIGCFRNKHHLAGANVLVPTTSGLTVLLNAIYCADYNRFYISYAEYSYYIEQYKSLLTKFVLNESIQSNGEFGNLADKSPLKLCGYTVSQERGLTQEERENILYEMISSGIISKPEAMQYIEWFIRFNGNREINHLARSKWESDLSYVRNLNLANQPNQKINTIRPYRK